MILGQDHHKFIGEWAILLFGVIAYTQQTGQPSQRLSLTDWVHVPLLILLRTQVKNKTSCDLLHREDFSKSLCPNAQYDKP